MKKYCQKKQYVHLLHKRAKRALRHRRNRNAILRKHNISQQENTSPRNFSEAAHKSRRKLRTSLAHHQKAKIRKHHQAPELCTLENKDSANECCQMFEKFKNDLEQGFPVFLDLSLIKELSCGAILYLLSIMEIFKQQKACDVAGNRPLDIYPRLFLESSGFFKYVNTSRLNHYSQGNSETYILRIIKSDEIPTHKTSQQLTKILDFIAQHSDRAPRTGTKALYTILQEIVGNVIDHAYTEQDLQYFPRWWLMATTTPHGVRLVVLDNGDTIPQTVNKRLDEKMLQRLNIKNRFIESALQGSIPRSSTKKSYRGQGLPTIYELTNDYLFEKSVIISGKEYVTLIPGQPPNAETLDHRFFGTLYSFNIRSAK